MDEAGGPSDSSANMERSHETATIRKAMHDAINRSDFGEVEKCLKENRDLRQWLDPITETSALCNALCYRQLKIAALLATHNCRFNERKIMDETDIIGRLKPMEECEYRYQLRLLVHKCDPAQQLVSKSPSQMSSDLFEVKVKELYEKLSKIPMVDTILRVVATTPWLEIIFDFQSEKLGCMLGSDYKTTLGLTMPRKEKIYLGAKREDDELLGTMAHEFCHAALDMVYRNGGKPYRKDDAGRRDHYKRILKEICSERNKLHDIIAGAFNSKSLIKQELVVRVPHMLAMRFPNHDTREAHMASGEELLRKQVPELFEFFKDDVIRDMEEFISKNRPEKDREQIKEQNVRLGKAKTTEDLRIEFKTKFELQDCPLLVLRAPNLTFLEVMINDAVRMKGESYVFFEEVMWDSDLQEALLKNKCSYVVLSADTKHDPEERSRKAMLGLLKSLIEIRETKVIILTGNSEQDEKFVKAISEYFQNTPRVVDVCNCDLANVTDKCKAEALKSSSIKFQEVFKLSVDEVMRSGGERRHVSAAEQTVNTFSDLLDDNTFLMLCRDKEIKVGPKLQTLNEKIAGYYIERTCERVTQVDLSAALRSLPNEAFAIVDSCGEAIDAFLLPGCRACNYSQVERFERCVLLDDGNGYDALAQSAIYRAKTVHLLRYDSRSSRFHWVRSNGPLGLLLEAVAGECEIRDMKELLRYVTDKVVVICGDPGMGKSVMSLRMAQDIKFQEEMRWVLHVDMQKINIECVDRNDMGVVMLAKLCGLMEDTFQFNLLERSISTAWPFKVFVIFDAFDEVIAQVREFLLELVVSLQKTMISKIFLFGRNCSKFEMQNKLHTMAFEIVGLKDKEQVQFLKMFWKRNDCKISDEKLDSFARRSLGRFSSQGKNKITNNPLLIQMIAEIDEAQLEQFEQGTPEENPVHREKSSILEIYEKFLENKLTIYMKKQSGGTVLNKSHIAVQYENDKTRSALYEEHGLLALKVFFSKELLTMLLSKKELRELETGGRLMKLVVDGHLKHGLVDGHNNGIPVFVHKTFAEFFAADFLANEVRQEDNAEGDVTKFVANMYRNSDYDGVLNFFDALGAKSHALHCHIMNNDWQSVENGAEVSFSRDAFSRSPLHIAALYADKETLDKVTEMHGEKMAEELLDEDGLGMTPLMYADSVRAWPRLNVFCSLCSERSVNWVKQLPVAIKNITEEKDFASSVIQDVVLMEYTELFNCLLKVCSDLKTSERPLVSDSQEMRHWGVTQQRVIDVDAIKCDFGHSPIFHATSYKVLKVLLPHSDIRAVGKDDSTLLHVYAAVGAEDVCKYVLHLLPSDKPNADGQTPLHVSTICSNSDVMHILIPHSATTRGAGDKQRNTPLHLAADPGSIFEQEMLCKWLLGHALYKQPSMLTHETASVKQREVMKMVIPHADATARNCYGDTALHKSSESVFVSSVMLLLPYSNVDMKNDTGDTALLRSVGGLPFERGMSKILDRELVRVIHDKISDQDNFSVHPCSNTASATSREIAPVLKRREGIPERESVQETNMKENEETEMRRVLCIPHLDMSQLVGDVTITDQYGHATYPYSTRVRYVEIAKYVKRFRGIIPKNILGKQSSTEKTKNSNIFGKEHIKIIKLLLLYSVVKATDEDDSTALHLSARAGNLDVVKLLFPHLSANDTDKRGQNSFHRAVIGGHLEVVRFFLSRMYFNARDHEGDTPLVYSAPYGHIDIVKVILPLISADVPDTYGCIPLHYSARQGHTDIVEFLLPHSFASKGNKHGSTPLHLSAEYSRVEATRAILPHSDFFTCDGDGDTALLCSAYVNCCDVVKLLLPYSEVNATNKYGTTSLAYIFEKDIQQFEKKSEDSEGSKESEVPEKKDIKMVKLLILHANSNVVDNDGRIVFRLAASLRWFNIKKLFLPHLYVTSVGIQEAHEDALGC
ncbi:uncharacterized protein LOC135366588 isoform X1 [Ornithodoros turicata]|uniref:uncharacterized protein LOC135366588 isoform X1 n=1 Tax=Ornithodoros turicata TaxID=34597 RepID=UPI003138A1A0